jgi:hypothetical protein
LRVALVVVALASTASAQKVSCPCVNHRAEAVSSGACRVYSNFYRCLIEFYVPDASAAEVESVLMELGVPQAFTGPMIPHDALWSQYGSDPEAIAEFLIPAYLSYSFRNEFTRREVVGFEIREDLDVGQFFDFAASLIDAIRDTGAALEIGMAFLSSRHELNELWVYREILNLSQGEFEFTVSSGCASLERRTGPPLRVQVKTPGAMAAYLCDGTTPPWASELDNR